MSKTELENIAVATDLKGSFKFQSENIARNYTRLHTVYVSH